MTAFAFERLFAIAPDCLPTLLSAPAGPGAFSAPASPPAPDAGGAGGTSPLSIPSSCLSGAGDAPALPLTLAGGIAIITIAAPLAKTGVRGPDGAPWVISYAAIAAALDEAAARPDVRGVLLVFDSPGGTVAGCRELAGKIEAFQKPVAAYADGLCASAAYWLAASTGRVFAPTTAQVGSIGVVFVHADVSARNQKNGVAYTYVTGGEWKAVGHPDAPLSESDIGYFRARLAQVHAFFREDVARAMHLDATLPAWRAWGDGQLFLAGQAHEAGLVTDVVASLEAAITMFAKEIRMNRDTLAAQHPDLLAEIETGARAAAQKDAQEAQKEALAAERASLLALVEALCGASAATSVRTALEAGVTGAQVAALAPLFAARTPQASQAPGAKSLEAAPAGFEAASRAAILSSLSAATPAALNLGAPVAERADTAAAIDRMGRMEK